MIFLIIIEIIDVTNSNLKLRNNQTLKMKGIRNG